MDGKNGKMYQVNCSPECAFMVKSHDKKEVSEIARKHAQMMHGENLDEKQVSQMVMTL